MKYLPALFFTLLTACAHPRAPRVSYAKPDVATVGRPVSSAKAAVHEATRETATATTTALAAYERAMRIQENGVAAKSEEAAALTKDVAALRDSLFRVTAQLRSADASLTEAENKIVELNTTLEVQTRKLNEEAAARATAVDEALALQTQLSETKRALWKARFWSWGLIGGGIALIVLAFVFKVVGLGARFAGP